MNSEPFVDYYALLGLPPSCRPDAIKDAFRSKMRQWHPDLNKSPEANQIAQQLIVAYKILLDAEARERYNRLYEAINAKNTTEDCASSTTVDSTVYDDPVLNRWIDSARRAARNEWQNFAGDFLDAGKDIGKQASMGIWVIVLWILGFLIAFALSAARR